METPASSLSHESDYKAAAWQQYTVQELGMWVHVLVRRAEMRSTWPKRKKDLEDAQAYLDMIQAHIDRVAKAVDGNGMHPIRQGEEG